MPAADLDAREMGWHQCNGNTDVFVRAEQMVGIAQLEGKAKNRRDRSERDVALVPVQTNSEYLEAVEGAAANDS